MALFADVVPERLTGVFNARRSLAGSVTGMVLVPLTGWAIARFAGLEGYQWVFLVGAALGTLGAWTVSRVHEPACAERRREGAEQFETGLKGTQHGRRSTARSVDGWGCPAIG